MLKHVTHIRGGGAGGGGVVELTAGQLDCPGGDTRHPGWGGLEDGQTAGRADGGQEGGAFDYITDAQTVGADTQVTSCV